MSQWPWPCPCVPQHQRNPPLLRSTMEEEYEVPSPHEHEVEDIVEKERDGLAQKIALMTAVLATIGALISYQSGSAQNEAMFLKNQSILKQAEASDQWAYYQAKSIKEQLDDAVAALASSEDVKSRFLAERARLDKEKAELQAESRKLGGKRGAQEEAPADGAARAARHGASLQPACAARCGTGATPCHQPERYCCAIAAGGARLADLSKECHRGHHHPDCCRSDRTPQQPAPFRQDRDGGQCNGNLNEGQGKRQPLMRMQLGL